MNVNVPLAAVLGFCLQSFGISLSSLAMASNQFSFATKDRRTLELLRTPIEDDNEGSAAITLEILETSLTANNKFYLAFGNKALMTSVIQLTLPEANC